MITSMCVCVCVCALTHTIVSDSAILGTVAHQTPLSVGLYIYLQEYWSGLPFPPPRDLPNPGTEHHLLHCRQILYC